MIRRSVGTAACLVALAGAAGPAVVPAQSIPGRVMTVTGPVSPDSLGMTLMHEHLFIDFLLPDVTTGYRGTGPLPAPFARRFQQTGRYFRVPTTPERQAFWDAADVTPAMDDGFRRGWLSRVNMQLDDGRIALEELARFKAAGGGAVVDVTTVGIGRAPERLRGLARASGVKIVAATGWYRQSFHPAEVHRMSVAQLAARMVRELTVGIGGTGIRAGIIGEIPVDGAALSLDDQPAAAIVPDSVIMARLTASTDRIRSGRARLEDVYPADELKVLRAAARASRRTGAAITLHAPDPWLDYLDLLAAEGADLHRVVIGHADQVLLSDSLTGLALARGVFLQLDHTLQTYRTGPVGPIDTMLDRMAAVIRAGHADQLLLSLDLCFRRGLKVYGGGGLTTLQDTILPGLRARGVSEADIRQIVTVNPARVLAITPPGR